MFIHIQMAKEKENLLLVTFEKKMDKARFECYLLAFKMCISSRVIIAVKFIFSLFI
jgi:hypothetical protein